MTTERIVKKVLAGREDLLLGQTPVTQTRQGLPISITPLDLPWCVTNLQDLKDLNVSLFYHAILDIDGLVTLYRFDATSNETADDDNYINPTVGVGQWVKVLRLSEPENILDRVSSVAALVAASLSAPLVMVEAYYAGGGTLGSHIAYKTGADNTAPTVGSPVAVSTIGSGTQIGYYWDATGAEWAVSKNHGFLRPEMFGAYRDGTHDDTAAINGAITYGDSFCAVRLSGGNYRTTASIQVLRLQSFEGDPGAQLSPDFTAWSGDLIALKIEMDDIAQAVDVFASMNRRIGGFRIEGQHANPATSVTTGIRVYASLTIDVGNAVNYAPIFSQFYDIWVSQFDTGLLINEMWNSTIYSFNCVRCRDGVRIEGKTVNLTFIAPKLSNFDFAYTTSVADRVAFYIDSGFFYNGGAEGRPEGISVYNGLINDADTDLFAQRGYVLDFYNCIFDGAKKDAVIIGDPASISLIGGYVKTSGAFAGIKFNATGSGNDRNCRIEGITFNNDAVSPAGVAIDFVNAGSPRRGVNIINNVFDGSWTKGINCPVGVEASNWIGNVGVVSEFLIDVVSGMNDCVIDGNHTRVSIPVLRLHPNTATTVKIGHNSSPTNRTYFQGEATVLNGTASIPLPNGFYSTELYYRPVTLIQPIDDLEDRWYVQPETSNSDATLQLNSNVTADRKVRYVVTAVPQTSLPSS